MKNIILLIFFLLSIQIHTICGDKYKAQQSVKLYDFSSFNPPFFVDVGINLGVRCYGADISIGGRFLNRFEVELGTGGHTNTIYLYSSSDKHELTIPHRPTFLSLKGDLYNNDRFSFYIKATGGGLENIKTEENIGNNGSFSLYLKGSLGSQFILWEKVFYVELFQYYSHLRGTYNSTYNSNINYDLSFYSFGITLGFKLNPLKLLGGLD